MSGSGGESAPPRIVHSAPARPGPNSWLAPAVVATLCCFSPTGIVALYYAAQVNVLWEAGNKEQALARARLARTWVVASIVLWALAMVILVSTGRAGRLLEAGLI